MPFEWISNDAPAFVTLDRERRFYFNATTQRQLGLRPYDAVYIAYDSDQKLLAVASAETSEQSGLSPYPLDKRCYASARQFVKYYAFAAGQAPHKFEYIGKGVKGAPKNAFIFRLVQGA
ncbi:hypothetical protein [Thalassobacillus sp. CUG 92003]|uniref:hypothetical protein n=1 Tax=Thalassobacillus sp. CUG 92003 TaxID=2736641 RepID=UPI0015E73D7F|nr:hypothetical protein [Thalassobacillus sp. CUG 92003]